jgi:hypothetical protein
MYNQMNPAGRQKVKGRWPPVPGMHLVNFIVFLCPCVVVSVRVEPFPICYFIWLMFVFEENFRFTFLAIKEFTLNHSVLFSFPDALHKHQYLTTLFWLWIHCDVIPERMYWHCFKTVLKRPEFEPRRTLALLYFDGVFTPLVPSWYVHTVVGFYNILTSSSCEYF